VVLSLLFKRFLNFWSSRMQYRPYSPSGLVTFNVLSFEIWILFRVFAACFV
jgi:hypothetical protein